MNVIFTHAHTHFLMYILTDLLPSITKGHNTREHSYLNEATYHRLKKCDSLYKYLLRAYSIEGIIPGAGRRYMVTPTSTLGHTFSLTI